mmetsp:Transcript_21058/g.53338  ORF Transcript_21058/g.53338 Transcript_21058/m.53338 type:complete len:225 (+) Transcript_21058:262-936(+)
MGSRKASTLTPAASTTRAYRIASSSPARQHTPPWPPRRGSSWWWQLNLSRWETSSRFHIYLRRCGTCQRTSAVCSSAGSTGLSAPAAVATGQHSQPRCAVLSAIWRQWRAPSARVRSFRPRRIGCWRRTRLRAPSLAEATEDTCHSTSTRALRASVAAATRRAQRAARAGVSRRWTRRSSPATVLWARRLVLPQAARCSTRARSSANCASSSTARAARSHLRTG